MISTAITSLLIVLIFCFGHVSTRQELHNRVVNSNIKTKKLFILIIGYDKLYNKQIWEYFFHKVDAALYRIFFHSKFPNTLEHSRHFQITVIDPVPNGYCKVSIVMNALLEAALKESNNDDCFVFLSADSIPVKPFKHIYEYLCGPIGTSVASKLCITPTSQWYSYESALYPKSHQWMSLNKTDAQNSVALSRASSTQSNPYAPLPSLESWCMEEVWHSFALYGAYNSSTSKLNELIYPSENEQGTCTLWTVVFFLVVSYIANIHHNLRFVLTLDKNIFSSVC